MPADTKTNFSDGLTDPQLLSALVGLSESRPRAALLEPDQQGVVVLPFTNLSGEPNQQYLSDGITEDIIIRLGRFKELKVTTRTAAFRFQGDDVNSAEAAKLLGAKYVVKGTALKTGNRLIISCQLQEAATGTLLWGERYDREAVDIFSVQDEVVARIVTTLGGRVITLGASSVRRKLTENWSAYDYFLKGRDLCNMSEEEASEQFFSKAVKLDPEFALAHAWWAIGSMGKFFNSGEGEHLNQAMQEANAALALDPNEATAHHVAGMATNYLRKFDRSAFHFNRAIELNPLEVNIKGDYASLLLHIGRYADALSMVEEILKRDPYPPAWLHYAHGKMLFFEKRFGDAINILENSRVYHHRAHAVLAASHSMLGNTEDARRKVGLMKDAKPDINFKYFAANLPFADSAALDFFLDALRKGGFDG